MKRFLLLIVLIFSGELLWGQNYKLHFFGLYYEALNGIKNETDSYINIDYIEERNYRGNLFFRKITEKGHGVNGWGTEILTSYRPTTIHTSGFVNFRKGPDAHYNEYKTINMCTTNSYWVSPNTPKLAGINFKAILRPIHSLKNEEIVAMLYNTMLPASDKVLIYAKTGFAANLYTYQYRVEGTSNWVNISSNLYKLHELKISATDLFGTNVENYVGKKLFFRVVSCFNGTSYDATSDGSLFLTVTESAPHINNLETKPVSCFDSSDGKLILKFDRGLKPNETLALSIVNTENGGVERQITAAEFQSMINSSNTIEVDNIAPGKYRLDMIGTLNGIATYTRKSYNFQITKPTAVTFTSSSTDVNCFGGSDGKIAITATGGQGAYEYQISKDGLPFLGWTAFDAGAKAVINNLAPATYRVKVRDTNGCVAKVNFVEKEEARVISAPEKPISEHTILKDPTGFGLSNGYIVVEISGGTPKQDGSYTIELRKGSPSGQIITSSIFPIVGINPQSYTVKMDGLPKGLYYLTVKDKNYDNSTSNEIACGFISKEYELDQPDLLEVDVDIEEEISCNLANRYSYKLDKDGNNIPDEAEDGVLKSTPKGGVPPYNYQWQHEVLGTYQNIAGATDRILNKITAGKYQLLIEDDNGNKANKEHIVSFPVEFAINLSINTLSCNNQNDGKITSLTTGGSGPYSYEWNTGDTTKDLNNLSAGKYFVIAKDAKFCQIEESTVIAQPGLLDIEDVLVENPTCPGGSNGSIEVSVSGGTSPYTLNWSNGMTGAIISGLSAGTYTLIFTDVNGCSTTKEYVLSDPLSFGLDLKNDITLCLGDTETYDVTISDPGATYVWRDTSGVISNDPIIRLSNAGLYSVTITNSLGCIEVHNVRIQNSIKVLKPEFLVSTHAYATRPVHLVNVSEGELDNVRWILPSTGVQIIGNTKDYIEVVFEKPGAYKVGMLGSLGSCQKLFEKEIIVDENNFLIDENTNTGSNIKDFIITPNPNNGHYNIIVKLEREAKISLRVMNMHAIEPFPLFKSVSMDKSFNLPFSYPTLSAGMYLIILETGNKVRIKKMIKN